MDSFWSLKKLGLTWECEGSVVTSIPAISESLRNRTWLRYLELDLVELPTYVRIEVIDL
jgi:hypothetical protein